MAQKIKGLTIEIGGDTTKLDKALSGINKEATILQRELGEIERSLKFDPGNTELLAQKQSVLAKSIENTTQKLKAMQAAQEQAQKKLQAGEIGEDQYNKFRREIINTENRLKKLQSESEKTTKAIEGGMKESVEETKKLNAELDDTGNQLSQVGSKSQGGLQNIKSFASSSAVAIGAITAAITAVIAAAKKAAEAYNNLFIKSNAELEQYITSFKVMLGDAESAQKLVGEINEMAASTPFKTNDLMKSSQMLLNYGVSADSVIDKMTQLGNLSAGNADKMDRITLAYGQMLAKGKVTGEELRQMTEAGVPMLQALADSMGVSTAELQKMISAGQVGIPQLNNAINDLTTGTGKFAGMMEEQAGTLEGVLSTLKDNITMFERDIGTKSFNIVKDEFTILKDGIAEIKEDGKLDDLSEALGNLFALETKSATKLLDSEIVSRIDDLTAGVTALVEIVTAVPNMIDSAIDELEELNPVMADVLENLQKGLTRAIFPLARIGDVIADIGKFRTAMDDSINDPTNIFARSTRQLEQDIAAYYDQVESYRQALLAGDEAAMKSYKQGVENHKEFIRQSTKAMQEAVDAMDETQRAALNADGQVAVLLTRIEDLGIHIQKSMGKTEIALRRYGYSVVDGMEHKASHMADSAGKTVSDSFKEMYTNIRQDRDLGYISESEYYKRLERLLELHHAKEKSEYTQYFVEIKKYRDNQNKQILDEQKKANEKLVKEQEAAAEKAAKKTADTWKDQFDVIIDAGKKAGEDLIKQQEDLQGSLEKSRQLYQIDDDENLIVNDLKSQTEAMREYKRVIDELRYQGADESFMKEFMSLDMEEGTAFGKALLSDVESMKIYMEEWREQQAAITEIAKSTYQDEADALQAEFTGRIQDKIAEMPDIARTLGEETAQEYIDGVKAGLAELGELWNEAASVGTTPKSVLQSTANFSGTVLPVGIGNQQASALTNVATTGAGGLKVIVNIGNDTVTEYTINEINEALQRGEVVINI